MLALKLSKPSDSIAWLSLPLVGQEAPAIGRDSSQPRAGTGK